MSGTGGTPGLLPAFSLRVSLDLRLRMVPLPAGRPARSKGTGSPGTTCVANELPDTFRLARGTHRRDPLVECAPSLQLEPPSARAEGGTDGRGGPEPVETGGRVKEEAGDAPPHRARPHRRLGAGAQGAPPGARPRDPRRRSRPRCAVVPRARWRGTEGSRPGAIGALGRTRTCAHGSGGRCSIR